MSDYLVLDLPIEPLEDRYSIEWTEWFDQAYQSNGMPYWQVLGDHGLTQLDKSHFLDPLQTWNWKFVQLRRAVWVIDQQYRTNGIKNFIVFLHDAWFPGIECFRYIKDMHPEINIRIVGFWHSGAYIWDDPLAAAGMESWVQGSEKTWFKLCDKICVGSEYHKTRILSALGDWANDADKVIVTGYPISVKHEEVPKEKIVVWPHRLSPEKHPDIFDRLTREPWPKDVQFIKTKEVCKTKEEYWALLNRAKVAVSTARLETFGIAMIEAAEMGCHPVCPRGMSYPETMEDTCLYDNYRQLVCMVEDALEEEKPYYYPNELRHKFYQTYVTNNICRIIRQEAEKF